MAHGVPITVMPQTAASIHLSSVKPLCRVLADFARVICFRLAMASSPAADIGADLGNIHPCSPLITLSWGKWGLRGMARAEDYRFAAECLKLGQTAEDKANRALFLQMARAWLALAQREEAAD